MVGMAPGIDKRVWYLCARCYFDGVPGRIEAPLTPTRKRG
jgi:hypothetical protein